ncbi:MAG: aminoacyl-tRNA hydrolase [bacterium]|nr:aminoacyl-tRNA hydrolase [bacterium]
MTRIVVGLGNPGAEYTGTRHNVGFEVLERLAQHEGELFRKAAALDGFRGPKSFTWARLEDPDALLVKPTTFMNRSGDVVEPLTRHLVSSAWSPGADGTEAFDPARLLVVYDDMDLDVGIVRIRPLGGHGGHNGMRSIHTSLGSNEHPRVRVGIGRPRTDAARHVLEPFSEKERVEIDISVMEASEAILDWLLSGDIEKCMTRFHSRWSRDSE